MFGANRDRAPIDFAQLSAFNTAPGLRSITFRKTSAAPLGERSRLPVLLKQHRPSHVVIELGGNDALRGLPLDMTRDNLLAMTRDAKAAGAKVMVVGMQVPPNYGARYGQDFAALFASVAKAEGAALVPFLLAGVADGPQADQLFQPDRIHPKAEAHPKMLATVWAVMKAWLR